MATSNQKIVAGFILLAIVVGAAILLTRKPTVKAAYNVTVSNPGRMRASFSTPAPAPAKETPGHPKGLVRYKNTERRQVIWDYEHMVPTEIIITRESLQLP